MRPASISSLIVRSDRIIAAMLLGAGRGTGARRDGLADLEHPALRVPEVAPVPSLLRPTLDPDDRLGAERDQSVASAPDVPDGEPRLEPRTLVLGLVGVDSEELEQPPSAEVELDPV